MSKQDRGNFLSSLSPGFLYEVFLSMGICFLGSFAALLGVDHFSYVFLIVSLLFVVVLKTGLHIYFNSSSKKVIAISFLLFSIAMFVLQITVIDNPYIFYILGLFLLIQTSIYSKIVSSPKDLLILCVLRIVEASCLVMLGASTQSEFVVWGIAILGFIPGCYFSASEFLKHRAVLDEANWNRQFSFKKNGVEVVRPGAQARVFSLLLVVLPGVLLLLVPFSLVPPAILLIGLLFYPALNILQDFQEETHEDSVLQKKAQRLAISSVILMFLIALLSVS